MTLNVVAIGIGIVILLFQILALLVLILVFTSNLISTFYGAPFVPMKNKHLEQLLSFGGLTTADILYDLGCGDGRVLVCGVNKFGIKKGVGYEISLWPYLKALFRIKYVGLQDKILVNRRDFLNYNLSEATFIYAYLSPKSTDKLAFKIAKEAKPGTKILCSSFPIDLIKHPEFILIKSEKIGKITAYLYEKI